MNDLAQSDFAQIVGALCVLVIGFIVIIKVTKLLMKLGIAIIVIGTLVVLFHDKLPLDKLPF